MKCTSIQFASLYVRASVLSQLFDAIQVQLSISFRIFCASCVQCVTLFFGCVLLSHSPVVVRFQWKLGGVTTKKTIAYRLQTTAHRKSIGARCVCVWECVSMWSDEISVNSVNSNAYSMDSFFFIFHPKDAHPIRIEWQCHSSIFRQFLFVIAHAEAKRNPTYIAFPFTSIPTPSAPFQLAFLFIKHSIEFVESQSFVCIKHIFVGY